MNPTFFPVSERLFTHFLDTTDGTICLPACSSAADVRNQTAPHKLRFPLQLDLEASLSEQIQASTHAPASHRFGPFCDNVIGMNWRLPTGRMVRIGERVVKTTTGYDWHRFLLHSGLRFGEPVDYVLRLRPDCGSDTLVFLRGDFRDLSKAASILLKGGWMHWLESLDFMASESGVELRIWIHTVPEEAGIFEAHLTEIAALTQTLIEIQRGASPPVDGIPDLAIKTTPDRAIDLARSISNDAIHSAALCYSGVVHVWLPSVKAHQAGVESLVGPHLDTLLSIGGDWRSRHIRHDKPIAAEAAWIKTLEEAIHGT